MSDERKREEPPQIGFTFLTETRYINNEKSYKRSNRPEYLATLRNNLVALRPQLTKKLEMMEKMESYYYERFYSQSWNVYSSQQTVVEAVKLLQSIIPELELHPYFNQILSEGTGKQFTSAVNLRWTQELRPLIESYSHTRIMIKRMLMIPIDCPDDHLVKHVDCLYRMYGG